MTATAPYAADQQLRRSERIPVAVLGATGSVGQRFVQLLEHHPWFEVTALTGSDRSEGQRYGDACRWVLDESYPSNKPWFYLRKASHILKHHIF